MRTWFLLLLLIVTCLASFFLLFGCGGSEGGPTQAGPIVLSTSPGHLLTLSDQQKSIEIREVALVDFNGGVDPVVVSTEELQLNSGIEFSTIGGTSLQVTTQQVSQDILRLEVTGPQHMAAVQVGIALNDGELIYGLTELLQDSAISSLNRRGEVVEMFVRPTMALYAPFYHSSQGYGLWVEGTMPGSFDIGNQASNILRFTFETRQTDSPKRFVFYLLFGPEHKDVLRQYHSLVGFPVRFPDWAFKHWRWRDALPRGSFAQLDGAPVNSKIAEDVLMYERFAIPFGVYLFDRPYLLGSDHPDSGGFGTFVWDESRIPNPSHTLEALKRRGMEIATWIATWALDQNGAEARNLGYLAPGNSRVIDLSNPAAAAWWQNRLTGFFSAWGIRGVKLDRGEEFVPSGPSDIWHDGRTGREIHNDFPVLQSAVVYNALQAAHGSQVAVLARAAYSGSQQFAGHWGGDTPGQTDLGLRMAIIQLQRAAFLGYPTWGSDTGGYISFTNREVFARWLEFSALCPIMEIGGQGSHAPWDMPTEPRFDNEMIEIYRRYVSLHHSLIPYTMQLADEAHTSGTPIARPMIVEYPRDSRFIDRWDQYMYGSDLLVAPIWSVGQRSRDVLLPPGEWEWYWDRSRIFNGPANITVEASLDTLPLFVRRGGSL